MRNGFTLIELLAVLVILAIIALIATPIVLNIINDTKESAIQRSAEMYLNAVEQAIVRAQLNNNLINGGTYNIMEDGNICLEGTVDNCLNKPVVEVKGETPSGGSITINDGNLDGASLELGNRSFGISGDGGVTPVCILANDSTKKGIEKGAKYECEVKPGEKQTFFVLSNNDDGTTNLIMDRNICEDGTEATKDNTCSVAWISEEDYGCGVKGDHCSLLDKGPVTAMKNLDNATSKWTNIDNLNITYNDEGESFSNFPITGKARLPYKSEVNEVGCLNEVGSCPEWMIDYLDDAEEYIGKDYQQNTILGIYGYWLLSSTGCCENVISYAWYIEYLGLVSDSSGDVYLEHNGVRPVITLKL